jgi:glycine cleavage system H lipoate-binding protein
MTALLVLSIFVLFMAADYIVRWVKGATPAAVGLQAVPGVVQGLSLQDFRVPQGVFFHPGHSWAALQPAGDVWVGIDDFVRKLAGGIDGVLTPEVGRQVRQGESLMTLKVGPRMLHLRTPVSGRVTAVNLDLLDRLATLGLNSVDSEWLVTVEPSRLADELGHLSVSRKATEWLRQEIGRLNEFLSSQAQRPVLAGATLSDGGEPIAGLLSHLDDSGWQDFRREFLL